jgi:DNA-binding transcriptional regulator YhcF (GntR family)
VDWEKLKLEYITTKTSYRKLAEKHGVSFNTLKTHAVEKGWNKLKQQAQEKATTKIVNSVASDIAKNSIKINDVADKLLDKICDTMDAIELLDSQSIKQLTSALKDLKDIKGIKSDADMREQEARIDKLRKDAMEEQKDTTIEVVMGEEVDDYAN